MQRKLMRIKSYMAQHQHGGNYKQIFLVTKVECTNNTCGKLKVSYKALNKLNKLSKNCFRNI